MQAAPTTLFGLDVSIQGQKYIHDLCYAGMAGDQARLRVLEDLAQRAFETVDWRKPDSVLDLFKLTAVRVGQPNLRYIEHFRSFVIGFSETGDANAQMARLMYYVPTKAGRHEYLQAIAEQENAIALRVLGDYYFAGEDSEDFQFPKDQEKARKYWDRAAALNDKNARIRVLLCQTMGVLGYCDDPRVAKKELSECEAPLVKMARDFIEKEAEAKVIPGYHWLYLASEYDGFPWWPLFLTAALGASYFVIDSQLPVREAAGFFAIFTIITWIFSVIAGVAKNNNAPICGCADAKEADRLFTLERNKRCGKTMAAQSTRGYRWLISTQAAFFNAVMLSIIPLWVYGLWWLYSPEILLGSVFIFLTGLGYLLEEMNLEKDVPEYWSRALLLAYIFATPFYLTRRHRRCMQLLEKATEQTTAV